MDVSPIRYHLKKPWNLAADRTQPYHTRKARQVVTAALEEIAPQDAENLWNSLVKSKRAMQQSSSEGEEPLDVTLIDALVECYNMQATGVHGGKCYLSFLTKLVFKRCKGESLASQGTDSILQGTTVFFMAEAL